MFMRRILVLIENMGAAQASIHQRNTTLDILRGSRAECDGLFGCIDYHAHAIDGTFFCRLLSNGQHHYYRNISSESMSNAPFIFTSHSIFACSCRKGSLFTSFNHVAYYKNLQTLHDLDSSGMRIVTSSQSLRTLFGSEHDASPLLKSLIKKFQIFDVDNPIQRTAQKRDMCSVERYSDIHIIIKVSRTCIRYMTDYIYQHYNPLEDNVSTIGRQCLCSCGQRMSATLFPGIHGEEGLAIFGTLQLCADQVF